MTFEREDYADLKRRQSKERHEKDRGTAETIARQAPPMEALTQDPNWDLFLSFLQAAYEQASDAAAHWQAQMANPNLVDPQQLMLAKMNYHITNERAQTLQQVMEVPSDVVKSGKDAKDLLSRLPDLDVKK